MIGLHHVFCALFQGALVVFQLVVPLKMLDEPMPNRKLMMRSKGSVENSKSAVLSLLVVELLEPVVKLIDVHAVIEWYVGNLVAAVVASNLWLSALPSFLPFSSLLTPPCSLESSKPSHST